MNFFSRVACITACVAWYAAAQSNVQTVRNHGSGDTRLCPGVIADVTGSFGPKATAMVGGKQAYVYFANATQLLIQIPAELLPGATTLVVSTVSGNSGAYNLTLDALAPALYSADSSGKGLGVFTNSAGNPISEQNPAHPGDTVTIVATGLGSTTPSVATGAVSPVPARTVQPASVMVGGKTAAVVFAGYAATQDISLVGTYSVSFVVPPDAPAGDDDVAVSIGGQTTNSVTIPVRASLPVISAVVNGASFAPKTPIVPGSFASVFVSGIGTADNLSVFPATSYGGVSVTFNGIPAPLFHVIGSHGQINLLVPSELPESSVVNVEVKTAAGDSVSFPVQTAAAAPGIFRIGTNAAAQIAGTAWIAMPPSLAASLQIPQTCAGLDVAAICAQPAAPGDYVTVYATGLGRSTPNGDPNGLPLATGQTAPATGNPLYRTVLTPQVTVAGTPVNVTYSGLTPGYAGLYQINFRIPDNTPNGDAVPIVVSLDGNVDSATIAVQSR
jgi:uncharacterized protein (TIGR03437 family)